MMDRNRRRRKAGGKAYLVNDAFTDTDGTSLSAHTPDIGGSWVKISTGAADMVVTTNSARTNGEVSDHPEEQIQAAADFDLSVTAYFQASTTFLMIQFRCDGANHPWASSALGGKALEMSQDYFRVWGWDSNVWAADAAGTSSIVAGQEHTIRVVCSGSSIKAYIDGSLKIDYTSTTHQTNTYIGLAYNKDQGAGLSSYFDNLQVT